MAPSRRQKPATGAQSTLSFSRSKHQAPAQHQSKVTKSTASAKPVSAKAEKLEHAAESKPPVDNIVLEPASPQPEIEGEPEEEDLDEVTARKIPDKQIKAYWAAKEASRMAPRVHQGNLSVHEKCLREWDMQTRFGVMFSSRPSAVTT